ncbi:hypothetical protein [Enterococcus pallens]|uniref:Uncharacterized protein n=1 Tax=Enterococcus pallens ATCC BAA-351 TaxID=1158607 RepID=R2SY48_9ENTE|nr:hypothetical protein UAU_00374 [Enterococcus pallens ATCC BAA-351]EOU20875.1 hypothetical protein I588_01722 [Enterococcus pallens ATCC BAA-351]
MVYLLLLVLGLIVLVQSYLLFSLMKDQRDLKNKMARLLRSKQRPGSDRRKTSIERGRTR